MNLSENQLRDYLFCNYRNSIAELIQGRREPVGWSGEGFPPIRVLLQNILERRINSIIDSMSSLSLLAKELRLERSSNTTTRIDLFGHSEESGMVIIELKKSRQTERQSFTELLGYANHFCTLFPGLSENAISSVLIAPMETRTVKDAYVQETLVNNKRSLALIPQCANGQLRLVVFYPDPSYYRWYEDAILDDPSTLTVAIAFQEINGWISSSQNSSEDIPHYSRRNLNLISNTISQGLEAAGFHSIVYASQKWGEIAQVFPFPNVIYAVVINPFARPMEDIEDRLRHRGTNQGRALEIQALLKQFEEVERDIWIESVESCFHDFAIETALESFKTCLRSCPSEKVDHEISTPNWNGIKTSMIDAVLVHNLEVHLSGLLQRIYLAYMSYVYDSGFDPIYYQDDLPRYSFSMVKDFMPVWEILKGLGSRDAPV